MKKLQQGFTVIEALIIVLALAVIGFGGYKVYQNHHDKDKPASAASLKNDNCVNTGTTQQCQVSSGSPYAGWKSYTLTHEKTTFKYPNNWILTNDNAQDQNPPIDQDAIELKAPDGFIMGISAQAAGGYGGDDSKILSADPVTFLGQKAYLQYKSFPTKSGAFTGTIDLGDLSTSATEKYKPPVAKNNITNKDSYSQTTAFGINFFFAEGKSVKTAADSQDISTVKLIIESMTY